MIYLSFFADFLGGCAAIGKGGKFFWLVSGSAWLGLTDNKAFSISCALYPALIKLCFILSRLLSCSSAILIPPIKSSILELFAFPEFAEISIILKPPHPQSNDIVYLIYILIPMQVLPLAVFYPIPHELELYAEVKAD